MHKDVCIIVPVYNEAQMISTVVQELGEYFTNILCVDDGSTDGSVEEIVKTSAGLVKHTKNKGQGAALGTGINVALQNPSFKYFVTFDADGQHLASDADRMVTYLKSHSKVEVALGSRFLGEAQGIGFIKRNFLKLAVAFSNFTVGLKLTDTHNGLRVFKRRFAENLHLKSTGMAHASEIIFKIARHHYAYKELPVTIRYTDYSKSKGQSMWGAFIIVRDLLRQRSAERKAESA